MSPEKPPSPPLSIILATRSPQRRLFTIVTSPLVPRSFIDIFFFFLSSFFVFFLFFSFHRFLVMTPCGWSTFFSTLWSKIRDEFCGFLKKTKDKNYEKFWHQEPMDYLSFFFISIAVRRSIDPAFSLPRIKSPCTRENSVLDTRLKKQNK